MIDSRAAPVNGLLRADHATRFESYQKAVNSGWMTPNQVAELEDMPANPSDAGDAYYIQGAMRNLEDVYKPPEPPAAAAAPAPMPMEPPMEDEEEERGEGHPEPEESVDGRLYVAGQPTAWAALTETQRPALVAAVRRCLKREANALARVREKHSGEALRIWAEDWQAKQRADIEAEFVAPLACLGALLGTEPKVTVFIGGWAARAWNAR